MVFERASQLYDLEQPEEESGLPAGTVLQQRYKILGTRKVGGMAIVYRAQDLRFEKASRICAVKQMHYTVPDPMMREVTVQNFEREANILASLSHPAIPSILDYFSEGTQLYLVMEFIEGNDLDEIIDESPEPVAQEQVIDWAIQICSVLEYLHHREPPVVFRDLKPTNIMLNQHGRIMLVDFGIAKVFERGQRGTVIGTAGYPPPEQYRGVSEPQGDIYALGATMHHLLTKRDPRLEPPFTFHEHPIRSLNPQVSEQLDAIVMKALEYDVEKRFETTAEFRQVLEALLVPARSGMTSRTAKFSTASFATHESDVEPIWEFACEDEIGSSPAVSGGVVYIGSRDHNLYAIDAETGEFVWKYATDDVISSSPCVWNELVLIGSDDRLVYALLKDSGRIAWSAPTKGRVISSPRVAHGHVFVGSDDHCLYNLDVRSGRQVWKFETGSYVRSSPAVSEEFVYFGSDDTNVYAVEIRTNKRKWTYRTQRQVLSSPLLYEGLLFFGSGDRTCYVVDAKAGWSVWQYRTRQSVFSSPAISPALGLVYFGSVDRYVYAFDYSRGPPPVWSFETEGPVSTSSPAVTEEAVYIGSGDGYLYCLDARTGLLRWKFYTGASVVSSPVVAEDMVFIGSRDHRLYALHV
jgi:outer membrane protein assembly factor BamB/tRNA A-37 threonylcarbamoyl transferase component Bud32